MCLIQVRLAHVAAEAELKVPYADELPSRQTQLAALGDTPEFDVLVVGGGATGAGCALDAVTRSRPDTLCFAFTSFLVGLGVSNTTLTESFLSVQT